MSLLCIEGMLFRPLRNKQELEDVGEKEFPTSKPDMKMNNSPSIYLECSIANKNVHSYGNKNLGFAQ